MKGNLLLLLISIYTVCQIEKDYANRDGIYTREVDFALKRYGTEYSFNDTKTSGCDLPIAVCPAPGKSCDCCVFDEESEATNGTKLLVIFGLFLPALVLLRSLLQKILRLSPAGAREEGAKCLEGAKKITFIGTWFMFAVFAPLFFVPELSREESCDHDDESKTLKSRVPIQQRAQGSQTVSSSNKRIRLQSRALAQSQLVGNQAMRKTRKRRKQLIQKFKAAAARYDEDIKCNNRLLCQAHCQLLKTDRELWFIDSVIRSLRLSLESQQRENRQVIQRYNQVHKQVLSYAATGAGDQ